MKQLMGRIDEQVSKITAKAHASNRDSPVYSNGIHRPQSHKTVITKKYKKGFGWHLYVLTDMCGKYYVGIAMDVDRRLKQHSGQLPGGAQWTKKFNRIQLKSVEALYTYDDRLALATEDYKTLEIMDRYGIENVRGGRFCSRNMSPKKVNKLRRRLAKI